MAPFDHEPIPGVDPAREPDFRLASWLVRPAMGQVERGGAAERLERRVMQVLLVLARADGRPVTRDALLEACWGNTVVTDDSINRCISRLRRLFSAAPGEVVIHTLPKLGYRLTVEAPAAEAAAPPAPPPEPPPAMPHVAMPRVAMPHAAEPEAEAAPAAAGPVPLPPAPLPSTLAPEAAPSPAPAAAPPREAGPGKVARPGILVAVAAALALLLAASVLLRPQPQAPLAGFETRPVTAEPGPELFPDLSPGGGQVAYAARVSSVGDNFDLFVRSLDAGVPMRLTETPEREYAPAWSPDGSRLAFARDRPGTGCGLFVMAMPAGPERQVGRCAAPVANALLTGLAWTADGGALIYADQEGMGQPSRLLRLSLADGSVTPVTEPPPWSSGDFRPAVSPDGASIAFVRSQGFGREEVYVAPLGGGEPRRLARAFAQIRGLTWAGDGENLYVVAGRGPEGGLWQLPADGGEARPVLLRNRAFGRIAAARGASRVVMESLDMTTMLHGTVPSGGGPGVPPLAEGEPIAPSTAMDWDPAVSPDGAQVAFISDRSGAAEVWVTPEAGPARRVTSMQAADASGTRWSPDGSRIAFATTTSEGFDIHVVEVATGAVTRITDHPAVDGAPEWTPDGKGLLFTSYREGAWRIWRAEARAGAPAEAVTGPGFDAAKLSPDGRFLYLMSPDPGSVLVRRPYGRADAPDEPLPHVLPAHWLAFEPVEDGVVFIAYGPDETSLFKRYDADGTVSILAEVEKLRRVSGFGLRPDGSLVITKLTRAEVDLVSAELRR